MGEIEPARRARIVEHIFGLRLHAKPGQLVGVKIEDADLLFSQKLLERGRLIPPAQQIVPENDLGPLERGATGQVQAQIINEVGGPLAKDELCALE